VLKIPDEEIRAIAYKIFHAVSCAGDSDYERSGGMAMLETGLI
jgi:hypothetical protein